MTTIAYRNGVMAAEGRVTLCGTILTDKCSKITRLSDGALFALCGEDAYTGPIIKYLEEEDAELPKGGEFTALLVEVDGTIKLYEGVGDFTAVEADYIALGSGSAFAYGAMDVGADAAVAVLRATERDPNSGGVIQIEHLHKETE